MQNIKITVLVAIYNAEKYLHQCLDSLRQQTLQECEFLCIDDCSTDSSVSIVESYVASDSRFKLMHTPVNSGQAVARNLGLACATGEYVTMLDADDWFSSDTLESAYRTALDNDFPDTVMLRLMMVDESNGTIRPFSSSRTQPTLSGQEAFRLSLDWSLHGYYIIRRDIHLRYPYDATYRVYSDDTTTRLHFLHSRTVVFSEGEYFYRQHSESVTHKYSVNRFLFMDAMSLQKQLIQEEIQEGNIDNPEEILTYFENLRWFNFLSMVHYFIEHKKKMSAQEQADILSRLKSKLLTFETDRIESRFKYRFGYIPIRNWRLFYMQEVVFWKIHPLYQTLKLSKAAR